MAGTNDLAAERPDAKEVFGRLQRLHEVCHERGVATVALAPPAHMTSAHRAARRQLAGMLSEWAQGCADVVGLADCEELVPHAELHVNPDPLWDPDDIHMNAEGSRTMGRRMLSVVVS